MTALLLAVVALHAFAVLVLPRVLPTTTAVDLTWGIGAIGYAPPFVIGAAYLAAALLAVPTVRDTLAQAARRAVAARPIRALVRSGALPLVIAVIALGAFLALDTKHALLGDSFRRPANVEEHLVLRHEQGAMHTLHAAYRLLHATLGFDGRATIELVSQLCGVVFVLATIALARHLGRDRGERVVIGALILLSGWVQLFFGYVETYPIVFSLLALYVLAGISTVAGRVPIVVPILLLGLSIWMHVAAVAFVPSLVVAVLLRHRVGASWSRGVRVAASAAGVLAAVAFAWIFRTSIAAMALPLHADGAHTMALFSFAHLRELANAWLLAFGPLGPLTLALLPLAWRRGLVTAPIAFLAAATAGAVAEMAVFDATLGRADWDILALPGVALGPLGATLVARVVARVRLSRVAIPVVGLSLLHTASWVGLNASDRAGDRHAEILLTDPGSYYVRQPGGLLASRALADNGLLLQARRAAADASERHPDDPRCGYAHAVLLSETGEHERAREVLTGVLRRAPSYLPAYGLALRLEVEAGDTAREEELLRRLFELHLRQPRVVLRQYSRESVAAMFRRLADLLTEAPGGAATRDAALHARVTRAIQELEERAHEP